MNYSAFLSYSHIDREDPEEWIDRFHARLEKRLKVVTGRKDVRIYIDKRDQDRSNLSEGLKNALRDSKLLLTLVSPSYLQAEWCTIEREYFISELGRSSNSLVQARKLQIEEENAIPEILHSQMYFKFYKENLELETDGEDFRVEMDRLARLIRKEIILLSDETRVRKAEILMLNLKTDFSMKQKDLRDEVVTWGYDIDIGDYASISQDYLVTIFLIEEEYIANSEEVTRNVVEYMRKNPSSKILIWHPLELMSTPISNDLGNELKKMSDISNFDLIVRSFEEFKVTIGEYLEHESIPRN